MEQDALLAAPRRPAPGRKPPQELGWRARHHAAPGRFRQYRIWPAPPLDVWPNHERGGILDEHDTYRLGSEGGYQIRRIIALIFFIPGAYKPLVRDVFNSHGADI